MVPYEDPLKYLRRATSRQLATAFPIVLILSHGVVKWLHHPFWKNVMLLHSAAASHDALHSSMFEFLPGEPLSYISPALVSHAALVPTCDHCTELHGCTIENSTATGGAESAEAGADSVRNWYTAALLMDFVLVHGVLKRLHHLLW